MTYTRSLARGGAAALALAASCVLGAADDVASYKALVDDDIVEDVRSLIDMEIVYAAVRSQNARHTDLSQDDITALDDAWRSEREAERQPLIAATLSNPLSAYLTRVQAHAGGLFTEIFVTDEHGLNVGQSAVTSDFWQGDEAKFQNTVPEGPHAVFVDEPEWHEDSETWRLQVNMTVADPQSGAAIGAATFEINLTELARRVS